MIFSGRRPREHDFFVRIALPECFHSHFVHCFRCLPHQLYIPSRSIIAAIVGPLCTPTIRIPRINVKRVMRYF